MTKGRSAVLLTAYIVISLLVTFIVGCTNESDSALKDSDIASKLDEFMTAYNDNCSYKYSGTVLVAQGDEILLNRGYGMANYEETIPNEPDTVLAIGSISKSVTAAAIMQLQDKGLLSIDDYVSNYIEDVQDSITIHHLITNTAGLPRDGLYLGKRPVSLEESVDYITKRGLLFEPGEDYSYSNAGYQLLAAVIEKVSGKTYNEYIRDNIFIPLEMDKSRGGTDASYADNQAMGYHIDTDDPTRLSIYNFSCITGSGNIYSTAEDLYKYVRGIHEGSLVTEESREVIFSPHWGDWSSGYGYGWEITEKYGRKRFSHGGNIGGGGYVSSIINYPDNDYVLIFLTNNSDYTALNVVAESMEAIIFGEDCVIPERPNDIRLDSEVLAQYAGEYDIGHDVILPVSHKDGKLYGAADDGKIYELLPISETKFCYEDHQWVQVEFFIDEENNDVRIKFLTIDRVIEGKKVNK